jgi:hypothetical protein
MQQPLQRSNELAPETPVPAAAAPQPSVNPKSSGDTEPQSDLPATPEQELEDSWTTEQYTPEKTAPEREADLRAFRRFANASARGAAEQLPTKCAPQTITSQRNRRYL